MIKRPDPSSVVKVGNGRGFIIEHRVRIPPLEIGGKKLRTRRFHKDRLVVTAAHCLPSLPPAHAGSFSYERTWKVLGTLDGSKTNILVECLFVDPVADIAVLGCPDADVSEEFDQHSHVYHELSEAVEPFQIGEARSGPGWVLSLDGKWMRTTLKVTKVLGGRFLEIDPTEGGCQVRPSLTTRGEPWPLSQSGIKRLILSAARARTSDAARSRC